MQSPFGDFMNEALREAERAAKAGEVPVGALVVHEGKIIGRGQNRTRRDQDPTAHAEIVAIREAARHLQNFRLLDCDLYVTLEPCAMCAGAIAEARIARLYFGAEDAKSGGVEFGARVFTHAQCHHTPEVYDGIGASESRKLLQEFFKRKRE